MKFIFGNTRLFIVEEIQPKRIQQAIEVVESAIQGKLGFCFKSVPKIPLHNGFEVNNKIVRRKRAVMNPTISANEIWKLRDEIKVLKNVVKSHILWDETTERKLKSNYSKLHNALILLSNEGIIGSYTLIATGKLNVNWFNEWQKPVLVEISQGFTYTYKHEPQLRTESRIKKEYTNDRASWPGMVKEDKENEIIGNIKTQGVLHKEWIGNVNSGPVGIDPLVLRYKQGQSVQIPKLKEVSDLLEGLEPKDIVKVLAWLMYLKERWRKEAYEPNG